MPEPTNAPAKPAKDTAEDKRVKLLTEAAEKFSNRNFQWSIAKARELVSTAGRSAQEVKFREDHGKFPTAHDGWPVVHMNGRFVCLRHAVPQGDGTFAFEPCQPGR